ncbi:hypothetical protein Syun_027277 [Stephania yunnanensis]|uniref:Uncharacterized protein n=1 Tax=Stephania yunnanensis TaxID=152371 RepID=A0AAP0EFD7_9MAGN
MRGSRGHGSTRVLTFITTLARHTRFVEQQRSGEGQKTRQLSLSILFTPLESSISTAISLSLIPLLSLLMIISSL